MVGNPTESYTPIFDTGAFPSQADPVKPLAAEPEPQAAEPEPIVVEDAPTSEPSPASGRYPQTVPGAYQHLKRWTFVLVVAGVWVVAAASGLGLYYWWYQSLDKTPSIFVLLVYLVVCTVGGLLISMVQNKPLMSALAIAMMSAPLASTAAAAALYGFYFCEQASRCLVGVIPY